MVFSGKCKDAGYTLQWMRLQFTADTGILQYNTIILNSYGINGRSCKTNMLSTCLSMTEKGIGNS
jgi:hypothetical protein